MKHPNVVELSEWAVVVANLRLSPREAEVASACLDALSAEETAGVLGISSHTVRTHLKRIYVKAGVRDRFSLLFKVVTIAVGTRAADISRKVIS